MSNNKPHLINLLTKIGIEPTEQLHIHLQEAHNQERPLPAYLAEQHNRKEEEILQSLATVMHVPFERLKEIEIETDILDRVPPKAVFQFNTIPIREENNTLLFATADPFTSGLIDALQLAQRDLLVAALRGYRSEYG